MSYNISSVRIIHKKDFKLSSEARERLLSDETVGRPASNVLDEYEDFALDNFFCWNGEGSGRTFCSLMLVLAAFDGEADLVLTWECGDSFSGLRLRDHKVTEHAVVMTLGA